MPNISYWLHWLGNIVLLSCCILNSFFLSQKAKHFSNVVCFWKLIICQIENYFEQEFSNILCIFSYDVLFFFAGELGPKKRNNKLASILGFWHHRVMVWFAKFPENLAVSIFKAKWLNSLEDGDSQILQRPQHGVLIQGWKRFATNRHEISRTSKGIMMYELAVGQVVTAFFFRSDIHVRGEQQIKFLWNLLWAWCTHTCQDLLTSLLVCAVLLVTYEEQCLKAFY
jgi:hypothetical protein